MINLSLRAKLIFSFSIVIVLGIILFSVFSIQLIGNTIIKQAQDKVRLDLNSAWEVYNEESRELENIVRLTANRFFIKDALLTKNRTVAREILRKVKNEETLDMITLIDFQRRVFVRAHNTEVWGDSISDNIVERVFDLQRSIVSTRIADSEFLEVEGESFVEQVRMEILPTPKARPLDKELETSGMMIEAAAPVIDYQGEMIGVLVGVYLLNRNYKIVDTVKDIVYKGEKYKGKDIGTATIFQDDLRIATNVQNEDGTRATGTRVSQEVYDHVVGKGQPWIGRAFVVNAWYRTAYEPIKNIDKKIIGILYVGVLEEPYVDLRKRVVFTYVLIAFFGVALLSLIAFITTNRISKPIKELVFATRKVAKGDLTSQVVINSHDEIGELAISFNVMTKSLKEAENKLKEWAKTLEQRVEERTEELEMTQKQLIQSEKLASLGKMAAGVAHEINNPLTAVLTFSSLLLDDIDENDPRREDLKTVVDETLRCRDIVRGLLDFSRETKSIKLDESVNEIILNTLFLIENQASFQDIEIVKELGENIPKIPIDASQMKQVFMNIFLNAAEAMAGKGNLFVATEYREEEKSIVIRIKDTGCGIPEKNLTKLFDPFFTTKKVGEGTGLGLAISYGIIKNHEGTIEVKSTVGKGTEFTIRLSVGPLGRKE